MPTVGRFAVVVGNDEQADWDADLLKQYRSFCEIMCRPMIEGRAARTADVRDALVAAPPELVADLELLLETMQQIADDPSYSDSRAGGASYRVGRWIESIGFDPAGFVRNAKRRANREAASQLSAARADLDEVASAVTGDISLEQADEIVSGAMLATFDADSAGRIELWHALRARAGSTGRWPVYIGEGIGDQPVPVGAVDVAAGAEQLDGAAILKAEAESREIPAITVRTAGGSDLDSTDGSAHGVPADRYPSLLLLPARRSHEALALLVPDFGESRPPDEHVAIARHLDDAYGAALAAIDGATIEFLLGSPPVGAALAQAVQDRQAYGDSTYGTSELDGPDEVFDATVRDRCWGFWFD